MSVALPMSLDLPPFGLATIDSSPRALRARLRIGTARTGVALAVTAALSGCSPTVSDSDGVGGSAPIVCKLADLGDPKQDIQLELVALDVNQALAQIADGGNVDLITPPQGGRVLFIGARATNVSPCGVTLAGSLKNTTTGKIMLDSRTVNLRPGADGWGSSVDTNISTFSNIPVCPNQWSSVDTYDVPYALTLTLTDKAGRSATKTVSVTPRCAETGALKTECTCTCKAGYVLGQACP